jgi:hypothetical protein
VHNEELNNMHPSSNMIRIISTRGMRWAGHVAGMEEMRSLYTNLFGQPEGRRPLGRPGHRWEGNIKMGLREIRCVCVCVLNSCGSEHGPVADCFEHDNGTSGSLRGR